jgi:hypothetical protein
LQSDFNSTASLITSSVFLQPSARDPAFKKMFGNSVVILGDATESPAPDRRFDNKKEELFLGLSVVEVAPRQAGFAVRTRCV